ncbi:hypothetical protein [Lapidilactobacillus gannanensis]|nr:hypothetical protein [Lapidilactobacillus gannanensis]
MARIADSLDFLPSAGYDDVNILPRGLGSSSSHEVSFRKWRSAETVIEL